MQPFRLARQLLRRDWRSGELRTLALALVIAVAAVASIGLVTDRLGRAMTREASELAGGDLVIRSSRQPDAAWLAMGEELGLATARTWEFGSVLLFDDNLLLSGIKAVSDHYPLVGHLRVAPSPGAEAAVVTRPPEPGSAWVDARVLNRLGARVGDQVALGATHLRIAGVLTYEPDQGNVLFQFAPRVMINAADLDAAEVLGPGSRVRYKILFARKPSSAGDAPAGNDSDAAIAELKARLEPLMTTGHRLVDPMGTETSAGEALLRAIQFIKLTALLAIVLAAIAIALAARRYSERHFDVSATLRCLGALHKQIRQIYLYQLLLLTSAAVLLGCAVGWVCHDILISTIAPLLPTGLPRAGLQPLLTAAATGALLSTGFALPPLLRLARISPLRIFRRDLVPMPLSGWLVYGLAAAMLATIILLLFEDVGRVILVLLASLVAVLAVGGLVFIGLRRLRRAVLPQRTLLGRSLRNLANHGATSTSQILAFALSLWVMLLIGQLRTDLLADWQLQLPDNVPNHFAFNIMPFEIEAFSQALKDAAVEQPIYPIVRGRLVSINGDPVPVRDDLDTNRELNLTWTDTLPYKNSIVEGQWPPVDDGISVEADYAGKLGIGIGDRLGFDAGGYQFDATVTSLRSLVWESFTPNFYIIFPESKLAGLPVTYLTSFRLEASQRNLVLTLLDHFPSVTIIEIDAFLERLQLILSQVSLAVELMLVFVLLGGFAVLFAVIMTTADERLQEGALMRAVGASRSYLRRACLAEFGLLGLAAGLLAVTGCELLRWYLYSRVFELDFEVNLLLLTLTPLAASAVIGLAGYAGTRRVVRVSPMRLLSY